jgi:hypothetical protein
MKRAWLSSLGLGLVVLSPAVAHGATGENSFTPTSFVMPIYSIMLTHGLTVNVPLYTCTPGTPAPPPPSGDAGPSDAGPAPADAGGARDCLVDMADATALHNLFAVPADIPAGTYDSIVVQNCRPGDHAFDAKVKGSVDLEGTTYYTSAGTPVISTDPADLGYSSINYAGCGGTVALAAPLTVHEHDAITVSAFFTLQNLSWVLDNLSPGLGGCAVAPAHAQSVCSGLPVLVAYIGAAAPVLDSYYITEDPQDLSATTAAGQVMLLSSGGEPFSGFLRRVYSHDSQLNPHVSYDVPLRLITKNPLALVDAGPEVADADVADAGPDAAAGDAGTSATYDIYSFGDNLDNPDTYRVRFPHFSLRDHDGTLFINDGESDLPYRAVKR